MAYIFLIVTFAIGVIIGVLIGSHEGTVGVLEEWEDEKKHYHLIVTKPFEVLETRRSVRFKVEHRKENTDLDGSNE